VEAACKVIEDVERLTKDKRALKQHSRHGCGKPSWMSGEGIQCGGVDLPEFVPEPKPSFDFVPCGPSPECEFVQVSDAAIFSVLQGLANSIEARNVHSILLY